MDKSGKPPEPQPKGLNFFKKVATDPKTTIEFTLNFDSEQRRDKVNVLDRKIRNN